MSEWLPARGSGTCSDALNLAGMNSCLISMIQEPLDSTKTALYSKAFLFLSSARNDPVVSIT